MLKVSKIEDIAKLAVAGRKVDIAYADCDPSIKATLFGKEGARVRGDLVLNKGVVVSPGGEDFFSVTMRPGWKAVAETIPVAPPPPVREKVNPKKLGEAHSYTPEPKLVDKLLKVLTSPVASNIGFVGPTGSGKTTLAKWLGQKLGRPVYRFNCFGGMSAEAIIGEKTVTLDETSAVNKVVWVKGVLERAMTEGLNAEGEEVGPAAILLVDELASMPQYISTAFNPVMETDDPRRTLVIDGDGGRVVRSHSGFRVIVTGNTVGRGAQDAQDALYTAQAQALDLSLLNRISMWFRVSYDEQAENIILRESIGNDKVVARLMQFRDAVRQAWNIGQVQAPFSTRQIVNIAVSYRIFGNEKDAVYHGVIAGSPASERTKLNEIAVTVGIGDLIADNE